MNVIGETQGGSADRVVIVGAHLDSVTEGPGINDNGSGTAAILEIAIQMGKLGITPRTGCASPSGERRSGACSARSITSSSFRARSSARSSSILTSTCWVRPIQCVSSTTAMAPRRTGRSARLGRDRGRLPRLFSRARISRPCRRHSTAARTTGRSSTRASPPAAFSPARKAVKTRGAGGGVRRDGGRALRPVLSPGLRRLRQQQRRLAGRAQRRGGARGAALCDHPAAPCGGRFAAGVERERLRRAAGDAALPRRGPAPKVTLFPMLPIFGRRTTQSSPARALRAIDLDLFVDRDGWSQGSRLTANKSKVNFQTKRPFVLWHPMAAQGARS